LKPYDGSHNYGIWLCPGNQSMLDRLIIKHDIRSVLEIGSCYGASACFFARHERIEVVTCVDLWCAIPEHGVPEGVGDVFVSNAIKAEINDKIRMVEGNSHSEETFRQVRRADLVYLDAGHTYDDVMQDILMYGPMARKVLCGDDYDKNLPSVEGVIRAVDEFMPERLVHGRLWWREM
jgi:cephalosporin hydroxylase